MSNFLEATPICFESGMEIACSIENFERLFRVQCNNCGWRSPIFGMGKADKKIILYLLEHLKKPAYDEGIINLVVELEKNWRTHGKFHI